ncbi:MAG: hypothetical protein MRY72_13910 [Aquisalinus sp.]|nr:hypothetical protein [Aquisalinus sp.]
MSELTFEKEFPVFVGQLKGRYAEPGRYYHTWRHIEAMLRHCHSVADKLQDLSAVEVAIYYHDAIYDPLSASNEHDSADLMQKELSGYIPEGVISGADTMIRATQRHELPILKDKALYSDCAFFLDMDLSILGASETIYDAYEVYIRQKYQMVPEALYATGRCSILDGFLEREYLHYTDYFRDKYEAIARKNLQRAKEHLSHS